MVATAIKLNHDLRHVPFIVGLAVMETQESCRSGLPGPGSDSAHSSRPLILDRDRVPAFEVYYPGISNDAVRGCELLPEPGHFCNELGVLGADVVGFAGIGMRVLTVCPSITTPVWP